MCVCMCVCNYTAPLTICPAHISEMKIKKVAENEICSYQDFYMILRIHN